MLWFRLKGEEVKGKREEVKGKREEVKGKRQKARGKRDEVKYNTIIKSFIFYLILRMKTNFGGSEDTFSILFNVFVSLAFGMFEIDDAFG
jgi:hypothetical protein